MAGNKNNTVDSKTPSKSSDLSHHSSSRRDFLKNTFFSLAAPSLLTTPLFRHGLGPLVPEAEGELLSKEALKSSPKLLQKSEKIHDKKLSFYNIHTGESLKNVVFWAGDYVEENLRAISRLFRDHRCHEVARIDVKLLNLLHRLHTKLEVNAPFHLISGYRSPKTNAMLCEMSTGVARKSQHCLGKAADIALPRTRTIAQIYGAAKSLGLGGVGAYSQFVHVDTGRVRSW